MSLDDILKQLKNGTSYEVNENFQLIPWDTDTFKLYAVNLDEYFEEYDLSIEGVELAITDANEED